MLVNYLVLHVLTTIDIYATDTRWEACHLGSAWLLCLEVFSLLHLYNEWIFAKVSATGMIIFLSTSGASNTIANNSTL